jgi:outer membrane cobalamin receptor
MMSATRFTPCFTLCLLLCSSLSANAEEILDEIIVTATKDSQPLRELASTLSVVDSDALSEISHTHINEALQRVPGVWLSRGNGQEHLTAIRSPVLTGAGSCGAFLMSQDGISLRAPGFCNVNELFEATTELADRIEVVKGPGSSVHGSNALHGIVNIISPEVEPDLRRITIEAGPHDYARSKLSLSSENLRVDFSGTHDGGYKDESGFDQQKLLLKHHFSSSKRQINTTFS